MQHAPSNLHSSGMWVRVLVAAQRSRVRFAEVTPSDSEDVSEGGGGSGGSGHLESYFRREGV